MTGARREDGIAGAGVSMCRGWEEGAGNGSEEQRHTPPFSPEMQRM